MKNNKNSFQNEMKLKMKMKIKYLPLKYYFHECSLRCICYLALRCNGINNGCCTETNPCEEGDGDCDLDSQCSGDLVCGIDNCNLEGLSRFNSRHDCCKKKVASFY